VDGRRRASPKIRMKSNWFRTKANQTLMEDLYLAARRAVAEMPRLKEMSLRVGAGRFLHVIIHEMIYTASATRAQINWLSEPRFEPRQEVLQTW
jgi:hypothetical protein